jgi:GH25 family lysozyme M1 (1,4-beta-N-acetylmuramidase)
MNFTIKDVIPDISYYQDANSTPQKIDFVKMAKLTRGVMIRAGQRNWVDEDFVENWQAAKDAGLARGTYWFYDSRETPQKQADLWRAVIGNDLPEMGIWPDLEESYHGGYSGETNWKKFTEAVKSNFPDSVTGIYTANWWWKEQAVMQPSYWSTFPLWVASYTSMAETVLPKPWANKGAVLWQFTSHGDGAAYGVESQNIDLNYTSQAFYDLFTGGTTPTEGTMAQWKCKINGLAVRDGNGTTHTQIDTLNLGDVVDAVQDDVTHWLHISLITRAGQVQQTAKDGWCSGNSAYMEPVIPPPVTVHPKIVIDAAAGTVITITKSDGTQEVITA